MLKHYLSVDLHRARGLVDEALHSLPFSKGLTHWYLSLQEQHKQGLVPVVPGVLLLIALAIGLDHSDQVSGRYAASLHGQCAIYHQYIISLSIENFRITFYILKNIY